MTASRHTSSSRTPSARERGAVVVIVLIATVLLSGLAFGLIPLVNTELTIAANHREAGQLLYAADAAAERTMSELMRVPSFSSVLSGAVVSASRDVTLTPMLPSRDTLDLTAMTVSLQALSDAQAQRGPDNPRWRLFLYQPLSRVARCLDCPEYIVAWVADDAAEADADPFTDSNAVVMVRARAVGRQGVQRTVETALVKKAAGAGILSWREVR